MEGGEWWGVWRCWRIGVEGVGGRGEVEGVGGLCRGGGVPVEGGRWRRGGSDVTQMVIEIQLTSPVMVVIVVDVVVALSVA